jgi:hypothetical protein
MGQTTSRYQPVPGHMANANKLKKSTDVDNVTSLVTKWITGLFGTALSVAVALAWNTALTAIAYALLGDLCEDLPRDWRCESAAAGLLTLVVALLTLSGWLVSKCC